MEQKARPDQQRAGDASARHQRPAIASLRGVGEQQHAEREQHGRCEVDHHLVVDLAELGDHEMGRYQRHEQPGHETCERREGPPSDLADQHGVRGAHQRRHPCDQALDGRRVFAADEEPCDARQQPVQERGPMRSCAERKAQIRIEIEHLGEARRLVGNPPDVVELIVPAREPHTVIDEDEAERGDRSANGSEQEDCE